MKERITFIYDPDGEFDAKQLIVSKSSLSVRHLKAAREHSWTLSLDELPRDLQSALELCHELHVRWQSAKTYSSRSPFHSRTTPGIHVSFSPLRSRPAFPVCSQLRKVFGSSLKCSSPEESFTEVPVVSERFSNSASHRYYQLLPDLQDFIAYAQRTLCSKSSQECMEKTQSLNSAAWLDIDYDSVSRSVTASLFHPETSAATNADIHRPSSNHRIEVGVLSPQPHDDPDEPSSLKLGGFLTVLGKDDAPQPALFSFPSRHHTLHNSANAQEPSFKASFREPAGLHPTLRLAVPHLAPPHLDCALHAYLTLPSIIFPDKYQLSDTSFLASKNLRSIRAAFGETDLEAPDYAVSRWGSVLLLELAPPAHNSSENGPEMSHWHADIPLHLRYLPPNADGVSHTRVPYPALFYACAAEEGTKMSVNPFDRRELGYDGLFGPRTMFHHIPPAPVPSTHGGERSLLLDMDVPVLDTTKIERVTTGTIGAILLGFIWVLWKLIQVAVNPGSKEDDAKQKKAKAS